MAKSIIAKNIDSMPRNEWLALRRKGIGGSDCAAACGLSRWKSPLQLFVEKTSGVKTEPDNEKMEWGKRLEPLIRNTFAEKSGLTVVECPIMFAFKEYPYMIANVDGIVSEKDGSKSLLEIKTVGEYASSDWDEGLPIEYYLQIQHYLAVTDLKKAYCAVLIGGNKFSHQVVERDKETIDTITALEYDFWNNHVLKGIPPAVSDKDSDILNTLYPKSNSATAILPTEADEIINEYLEIKALEEELKKQKALAENKLKSILGDNEGGQSAAGYSVNWKSVNSNRLDTARLKADHPEIIEQYSIQSTSRRFSITAPKNQTNQSR